MRHLRRLSAATVVWHLLSIVCFAQSSQLPLISLDHSTGSGELTLAAAGRAAAIYVAPQNPPMVRVAVDAFASDVERVAGVKPKILTSLKKPLPRELVIVGVLGHSPEVDRLGSKGILNTSAIDGKWESALTAVVQDPMPGVHRALVIAGSDRRGAAFALFTLSRQMGVSPWAWWADVPVKHHTSIYVRAGSQMQAEPSVQYRGIFLNDEDWGLRPWAAKKMDPQIGNIGPHTYERIFELLLRLHANSLWPAMHPGSRAFNTLPENARLADQWGIVMGSSHSEALLRNNVGEWDEKRDGHWNYQINRPAIDKYWDERLAENGKYENFYTVGMRGVHDSGLEAEGTAEVKARLVEEVMSSQQNLLRRRVNPDLSKVPQVIWLYKESLGLYRVGMKVPADVTLGWTDDNYGYIRELPTVAEQQRPGGSGVYYHVSYWGAPHDYLWLCSTPPALIREELTKAYDHNARRYWILNVGDIKPAEIDIDYFLQLAWDEPHLATVDQSTFLERWAAEQFPPSSAPAIASVMARYYQLNFVRKPEFMGFNGYNDGINRTAFNPMAWGDQNHLRSEMWARLREDEMAIAKTLSPEYQDAFFELVAYPVEAAAAQNHKFLFADRSFLHASQHKTAEMDVDRMNAQSAYDSIQSLTARYNSIQGGKWNGMMFASPHDRQVFKMTRAATAQDADTPLPSIWGVSQSQNSAGSGVKSLEKNGAVSINAARFDRKQDGKPTQWRVLSDLGISGESVVYGSPGLLGNAAPSQADAKDVPWLEYHFDTVTSGEATLTLHLLPTFPVDSQHQLRYAIELDGKTPVELDASGPGEWHETSAAVWSANVLRNSAIANVQLGAIPSGSHVLRLIYRDPGVIFEHLLISFPGAAPAYPVP